MTPQIVNNHTTKDLMETGEVENSILELKRMMVRAIMTFTENVQKQVNRIQETMNK
jgi:hypothetical protein